MPCYDGRSAANESERQAQLDTVTRLLCETCKAGAPTSEALAWFEKHKAEDERARRSRNP